MPTFRDQVLLLRRTPFGESSLVVQGLSREFGRVHLLAKGAYRSTSRFANVLDLVDTLELEWRARPQQELGTLTAGRLAKRRRRVSASAAAWQAGTTALELTEMAARPGDPDPALFDLLEGLLDQLDQPSPLSELALVVFELRFLRVLGLAPALVRCAVCGEELAGAGQRATFSSGAGGRLCSPHAREARKGGQRVGTLPTAVLETAQRWSERPFRATVDGQPNRDQVERVRDFVGRFLDYHLEARPKSHRRFLSAPDRNRRGLPNGS